MAVLALPGSVRGQAADAGWGGSVVLTTDYVFRGLSQTRGAAALQADLHYQGRTGWFAGGWASNIDPASDYVGKLELNAYAGWAVAPRPDWTARLTYVRYIYPDATAGWNYDYGELSAGLAYQDRVFVTIGWSPDMVRSDYSGADRRGTAYSYELSVRQPLWAQFAVTAGAGYYDLQDLFHAGYWSWSAGLSWSFRRYEVDLSRFGNDGTARDLFGNDTAGDRWALTAIWRF